jgi:hypothetical protein
LALFPLDLALIILLIFFLLEAAVQAAQLMADITEGLEVAVVADCNR